MYDLRFVTSWCADRGRDHGGWWSEATCSATCPDVEGAYAVVVGAMEKVCTILDVEFGDVFDRHEGLRRMSMEGQVDLFNTDPPYNVLYILITGPIQNITFSRIHIWKIWFR